MMPDIKETIEFRASLFWDIDASKLDPDKYPEYVIERILDFGHDNEVRWMWQYYDHDLIRKVVKTSRVLHGPTRSLWNLLTAT